jgi:hypothetical protein
MATFSFKLRKNPENEAEVEVLSDPGGTVMYKIFGGNVLTSTQLTMIRANKSKDEVFKIIKAAPFSSYNLLILPGLEVSLDYFVNERKTT